MGPFSFSGALARARIYIYISGCWQALRGDQEQRTTRPPSANSISIEKVDRKVILQNLEKSIFFASTRKILCLQNPENFACVLYKSHDSRKWPFSGIQKIAFPSFKLAKILQEASFVIEEGTTKILSPYLV